MFTKRHIMPALAMGLILAALPMAGAGASTAGSATVVPNFVINVNGVEPFTGTGCSHGFFGNDLVCIYVNGNGRIVYYATVTNHDAPTGEAMISDTYNEHTYDGPYNFGHGKAWRHNFDLVMKNGDKVCGSVSGLDVACLTIRS
jgi:hypothetical protein